MDLREPEVWLIGLCVAALVGCLFMMVESNKAWQQFKVDHKCVVVGKMDGDVVTTVGVAGNGQVAIGVGSTGDKTGWKCDDGITYWK